MFQKIGGFFLDVLPLVKSPLLLLLLQKNYFTYKRGVTSMRENGKQEDTEKKELTRSTQLKDIYSQT
jgi:hypothetical protein